MQESQSIKNKAKEFNDKMKEIKEKLELPQKQKIISIEPEEDINLGGDLNRKSVFVIKIQDEKGEFYHIVVDKETNAIATIAKDGKIELTPREKQLWEKFIGKENNQTPDQKNRYDFEKAYYLEKYRTVQQEQNKEKSEKKIEDKEEQPEDEKTEAAEALNMDRDKIIALIKIEDRETFGQAINTKLYADAYIVKYGNNKTKVMQTTSDGKLKELAGLETSEFNSEVMEQLNMDKPGENQKIKAGDLTTIKTEDPKYNYVVVREHDSTKGIVIVNSENDTNVYTFNDEGKETIEEIRTAIQYQAEIEEKIAELENQKQKLEAEAENTKDPDEISEIENKINEIDEEIDNKEYEKVPWENGRHFH